MISVLLSFLTDCFACVARVSYSGWLGAPSFDSFRRYSNASDWNFNSSLLIHSENRIVHQPTLIGRLNFNFPADAASLNAYGEAPFRRVVYLSQLLQALCLRQESEHYRRGRDFSPGVAAGGHCTSSGSCKISPGGGIENWQEHAAGTMGSKTFKSSSHKQFAYARDATWMHRWTFDCLLVFVRSDVLDAQLGLSVTQLGEP